MKVFFLSILVSLNSYAMGELQGYGKMTGVSVVEETKSSTAHKYDCTFNMDIHDSSDKFHFELGIHACGGQAFQDSLPALIKFNNKLFLDTAKTKQVGQINADGTIHIAYAQTPRTRKITEYVPDETCGRTVERTRIFNLYSEVNFKFKKNSDGSWAFDKTTKEDDVTTYRKRQSVCPYYTFSRVTHTYRFEGTVK